MKSRFSTGALARRSARRPWLTIAAWLGALVVSAFLIFSFLGDALTTEADVTNKPESKAAELLIGQRLPRSGGDPDEALIVRSTGRSVDDPAFRAHVEDLLGQAARLGAVPTASESPVT